MLAEFTAAFGSTQADLVVSQAEAGESVATISLGAVDEAIGETIVRLPEVEEVAGMALAFVPMPGIPFFVLFGHGPAGSAIGHFQIVEGEGLAARAPRGRGKPILLGRAAADNLVRRSAIRCRCTAAPTASSASTRPGPPSRTAARLRPVEALRYE